MNELKALECPLDYNPALSQGHPNCSTMPLIRHRWLLRRPSSPHLLLHLHSPPRFDSFHPPLWITFNFCPLTKFFFFSFLTRDDPHNFSYQSIRFMPHLYFLLLFHHRTNSIFLWIFLWCFHFICCLSLSFMSWKHWHEVEKLSLAYTGYF